MRLTVSAERSLPCTPEVAFRMATSPERFPAFFTGFGPIPAVSGIRLHAPLAVGSTRRVHNADGTVLSDRVTVLDPPVRHAYVLTGFRPPFSWLVTQGEADWTFAGHEFGSRVRWDYEFTLARRWLATFDLPARQSGALPQGIHLCLCTPDAATAALGVDGHPARDDSADSFFPPIPLPRRMWAASDVRFLAPISAGAAIARTSNPASASR